MSSADHPEWDAYVTEIRDLARGREVEYIGRFTELRPAGGDAYCGLSPLRDEKTASFYAYAGRGFFDFGTQQGGDLFHFVKLRNPTFTFREVVDELARQLGADDWETRKKSRGLSAPDPESLATHIEEESFSSRIFGASTWMVHTCHELMPTQVREHLRDHYGYTDAFIDAQKVGFCPDNLWELCHWPGEPRPFTDEELLATGWFHPHGEGSAFATLAGRIVFPYWKNGQARYAIGRAYFGRASGADVRAEFYEEHAWDKGKYKKLPVRSEKRDWIASCVRNDVLWGEDTLHKMRDGVLTISEGVTDAGALAMLGFAVLSPVTVNFRNDDVEHVLALLAHYRVKKIIILNDNDTTPDGKHPGLDGAKRMAAGLWKAGHTVAIGRLPRPEGATKVDVNELVAAALRAGDAASAKRMVEGIQSKAELYPEFLIQEAPEKITAAEAGPLLAEVGTLAGRMEGLAFSELMQKALFRFRGLAKKEVRAALYATYNRARAEHDRAAKERPPEGGAAGGEAAGQEPVKKKAPEMRGHVLVHPDGYYEREASAGTRERISNFRLMPVKRIVHDRGGRAWHAVRIEGFDTAWDAEPEKPAVFLKEWPVPPTAWVTKRAFLGAFPNEHMVFSGSDDDVQGILELLAGEREKTPTVRSTGVLGRHVLPDAQLRFVLPAGTLGPDGWLDDPDLVYLPDGGSNLQHRLPKTRTDLAAPETLALLREVFASVLLLHKDVDMAALVSWQAASLFAPFIRSRLGIFPLLNVFGTPGSGKTSIMKSIVWPIFSGVERGELLSCTSSAFAYARDFSSANAIALGLDEYRPSDMGQKNTDQLHRYFRRLYSGDVETRGRADQDLNLYYQGIPLFVLGEKQIEGDQAISERFISVGLDPNWLPKHPARKALFYALSQKPLASIAPLLQAWTLRADAEAMLAKAQDLLPKVLGKLGRTELPERVKQNITVLIFGAIATDAAAAAFGTAVADVSILGMVDKVVGTIFSEEDSEGGRATRVRNFLDEAYCEGATMANLGVIQEGKVYVWVDGKLRIWLTALIAASAEWRRGQGLPPLVPGLSVLRRIAREQMEAGGADAYVTALSKDTALGDDRRARCIEIDPEKVPASLGAGSYPAFKEKAWGGKRSGEMDWAATARASRRDGGDRD